MPEIGETLREARMRAKIDISEVEASTKIRAKYLRALENEDWDLLPGSTFVRSFLRTYADYPGLDRLRLVPGGRVCVCLVGGRGRRVIDGQIIEPGGSATTYKGKRFAVLFGHGPQQMRVNGRTVAVPASSDPVGYEVTPTGRRE